MTTGEWLRRKRESLGLSAEEAWAEAMRLGVPRRMLGTPSTLRRQEAKDTMNPVAALVLATDVYGVPSKKLPKALQDDADAIRHLLTLTPELLASSHRPGRAATRRRHKIVTEQLLPTAS